ncbi:3-hydroxyacyl-CoA dehydrogenase NAD-binding domain-containing protein [Pseudomonas sp. GD03860]|uniref:3-hydroxyacyl-CoA dehydrogenase NAD-binding domain-containing protein n=1 Tax=Pseudomonas TaxID=286 RepID=UPI002363D40A|nr:MULTISPECIES: 3-hydroxyacyl-CoA dehydrogenase NAD-binding domain-containing protein [Pseudomonas]MDD2058558.1 3-hydroxyacyl-CoA dehydrogenase NAD-binding domain-containing protein [Pseudomonas putida]MDH0639577.1 3-hydroxyacyl-CoA dehydrogenase NAD-binding domain-containing protein [Pseudomonas sp. GD03860]
MSTLIHYHVEGDLALIGLARPPVNALGQPLREALLEACERAAADPAVRALVLHGQAGLFCAGADISEFGSEASFASPDLPGLLLRLTQIDKPLIAAIRGLALGGGLELALACGYRIGEPQVRLGLPEISLGLLPGAGGTQRLPRLIGAEPALEMMISGQPINASRALELGLLDRLADSADSLLDAARQFARALLQAGAPARPQAPFSNPAVNLAPGFFEQYRQANHARWKDRQAPRLVLAAVEAACSMPLIEGLEHELELFKQAEASQQSEALRHVFFAEREAGKVSGVDAVTPLRPITRVAVIGAGTMGGGIAMNFLNVGIPVTILELQPEALERGLAQIRKNYEVSLQRGKLDQAQLEQRMALLSGTLNYADVAAADLVIEAVFERLSVKQQVFRTLDEVCKPWTILATNTSSLDVDAIAAVTRRPQDVIGLHFFSPANVMRLLEVVRGKATAPDVLASVMKLGKRIGKIPVVSGVCFGFIGNRMLEPYNREAHRLVLEGATPAQVDAVLTRLGLNMGVLSMTDLAGVDVNFLVRDARREQIAHDPSYYTVGDELYTLGRFGQKTGRGFYRYEGRERHEDYEVVALAERLADELQVPRRAIDDQEIHDRCLFMLINEGIQLLDEGIAERAGDIDLVWINGYGFPAWLGGPLHYAGQLGLAKVLAGIEHYRQALGDYGQMWFQPAPLLQRLVAAGHTRIGKI